MAENLRALPAYVLIDRFSKNSYIFIEKYQKYFRSNKNSLSNLNLQRDSPAQVPVSAISASIFVVNSSHLNSYSFRIRPTLV